jgi:hypothetical protein
MVLVMSAGEPHAPDSCLVSAENLCFQLPAQKKLTWIGTSWL